MRLIKEIIIHCTATVEGKMVRVSDVDIWHKAKGWNGIGYHYLIGLCGEVWQGRKIEIAGAHCTGHNQHSIGICYVGGLDKALRPKDTRTPLQTAALQQLIKELKFKYPNVSVHGHREFANKACPCFDVKELEV